MLKDAALEQHYQDIFEMYGSRGWQRVQWDFAEMLKTHNSLSGINTEAELQYRKGMLDVMSQVVSHQDMHERAYAELVEEQTGETAEAPTGGVAKVIDPEQSA